MPERLYRVTDRTALKKLRDEGVRIVFQFPGGVVLREPLRRNIDGLTEIDAGRTPVPTQLTRENIGEAAYALRSSQAWRTRKTRRPHADVSMDQIIAGNADKIA
ncbi:MAG TPA: hypothetical protein VJT15_03065 [Pyrinomonadaceae bacterium]|nr:hypothetical protein [Pyrinomonadaceae bacterium]